MMIALPNQDKSWTVTLFMPFDIFDAITTPEKLLDFFKVSIDGLYCNSGAASKRKLLTFRSI